MLKGPLEGVYLSFFLGLTLMILVSATWMGLYLAKRITRPVQMLAEGAREIGAGHLDHRIEPETVDEFGSLVEAFNTMASELATSRRRLERSRLDLEHKSAEAEDRRRYLETILERVATGVICLDAGGRISIVNTAARRLLGLGPEALGEQASSVFAREDLRPLGVMLHGSNGLHGSIETNGAGVVEGALGAHAFGPQITSVGAASARASRRPRKWRSCATAARCTSPWRRRPCRVKTASPGTVVVFDDVTPLMRAQKVAAWRDVARRLAHEIKNPLTPIQLSAERLRRHFRSAPDPQRQLVEECSTAIVVEVESLKSLVDEFSQFARMPAPRTVPSDLHPLLTDALSLYNGLLDHIRSSRDSRSRVPRVRVDPEQFRRVIINLVDNAIEALNGAREAGIEPVTADGLITIETSHDPANAVVRVSVADNGPGLPAGDRSKLFMPYYSTKGRGSGLGLAIVRRIIAEHGGSIEAGDNPPHGARFTIELPC